MALAIVLSVATPGLLTSRPAVGLLAPRPAVGLLAPRPAFRAPVARSSSPPTMMARWTAADMKAKRVKLPAALDDLLSEDTPRREVEVLWAALRSCFKTEDEAIAAAARNTGTILPCAPPPAPATSTAPVPRHERQLPTHDVPAPGAQT